MTNIDKVLDHEKSAPIKIGVLQDSNDHLKKKRESSVNNSQKDGKVRLPETR